MSKKILSIILTLVMCLSLVASLNVTVSAAAPPTVYTYPSISSNKYIEFTAAKKITVYVDKDFSAAGTSSPYKKYSAYIAKNDVCYIYKITSEYAQVNYPTSSGRKTGFVKTKDLLGKNMTPNSSFTATSKVTTYKYKNGAETGYYESGDTVYVLDGTNYNVIYTAKSGKRGYKLAWGKVVESQPEPKPEPEATNGFVSDSEIRAAASKYNISTSSNAYKALQSINTKYDDKLTDSQKKGVLVFLFEGVGSSSKPDERFNAMCVVVKNKKIVYLNRNSTTIPDYPFNPKNNRNDDNMPTLMSGIYNYISHNHPTSLDNGDGKYAALKIQSAKVLRFKKDKTYYEEKGVSSINVHRRIYDDLEKTLNKTWANSAGCMNIGKSGTGKNSEYSKFVKAVGIVDSSWSGYENYKYNVTGKIIIDRSYAESYLKAVGYSSDAIKKLG